jgi:xanthine dehydrogenase accessory factor
VGKAIVHLAKWLGFRVIVSDDRAELCTPEVTPEADAYYPVRMSELPKHIKIDRRTFLILTTRGSNVDVEGLAPFLDSPAAYIGVIGSKRRWASTVKELKKRGVAEEKLSKVHSPIGLELQAETPEEIAVSIMAEVLMVRDKGTGRQMKAGQRNVSE